MTGTSYTKEADTARAMRTPIPEEHFRLLVESVRDYAIFLLDPSGRVATWNAGAEAIKGYSPNEIIGKHVSIFYTEEDRRTLKPQRLLDAALADGRVEDEGFRVRKDGSRFWADVVITPLYDPAGQHVGFAKVTRDLTVRRQAEQKQRQAEEMLAATLHSIGDAVLATDEKARIAIINPVAERLTGWSKNEALGRPLDEVFNIINEDTRARAFNPVARVLEEGIIVGLANHTALISRDGTERPIADSGAPIRDAQGRTRGAVLVFRDVTDERAAEEALRQSEERLRLDRRKAEDEHVRLAQAREAVRLRDEFLSIASHELRTPLTALQLQLQGLLERLSGDEKLARKAERAVGASRRLADLIDTLLDVSRIAAGQLTLNPETFDLVEVTREIMERLREAALQPGCELSQTGDEHVVGTWDRIRVEQIITNLLGNAIKYAPGAPVTVTVKRDDDHALLEVHDRGPGIREKDLPRIFGRFERASSRTPSGMGLGLYIARQVAEAHGGTIAARNLEGGGACFTLRLPLVPPLARSSP